MNQDKIERIIIRHKKLVARMGRLFINDGTKEDIDQDILASVMIPINKTAREINPALANFKCEKCASEENLEQHHIISKKCGKYRLVDFMNYGRYVTARHYFSNSIILCEKHHLQLHEDLPGIEKERLHIEPTYINKLKKKYSYKPGESV